MNALVPQAQSYLAEAFESQRSRYDPGTSDEIIWRSLGVLGARNGEGPLGDPRGLPFEVGTLAISSWSNVDLDIVKQLPALDTLNLRDCTGVDLSQIGDALHLHKVELYRSVVTSLEPLAHRKMHRLAVWGCPLEPRWYDWLREQWAKGTRGERPKTFPESTWKLSRKLYERGLVELVAFLDDEGRNRISMAGNGSADAGLAVLPEEEVDEILARYPNTTSLEMLAHLRKRFHELVPQIGLVPKAT